MMPISRRMVWFFERDADTATCEVSKQHNRYTVAARHSDACSERVVESPEALFAVIQEIAGGLIADGWRPLPPDPLTGVPVRRSLRA